jgi:hypothetical protein
MADRTLMDRDRGSCRITATCPIFRAKTRRTALEALSRDALAKLTERFDLAVKDRRSAAAHVDAL